MSSSEIVGPSRRYRRRMPLKPGDKAPAFTLLDQDGNKVKLSRLQGPQGARLLLPEGRHARAARSRRAACATSRPRSATPSSLGISPDKPAKQKKFDDKYGLGFPLLADEDHAVAEAYDVWTEKSMYGRKYMGILRSAFLVDEKGKIAEAWYKVSPKDTAANLLKSLG